MLRNRPIVSVTIGYILGIIMGLYYKTSIVFLYVLIFIIYLILKKPKTRVFKLISFRRYFRYVKIIITRNVFFIIIISSVVSNSITLYQNYKYENLYVNFDNNNIIVVATVVSNAIEKDYKNVYKIKIESVNENKKYKNTYMYLNVKKNQNLSLEYGDKVNIVGKFKEPSIRTNYKGFDYKEYLKTLRVYGTIELEEIVNLYSTKNKSILKYSNIAFLKIKETIQNNFEKDIANVLLGITLGYTDEIDKNIKEDFTESNISHVLAVSGMHVGYLIIFTKFFLEKLVGKRNRKIITSIILIMYMFITGFSPSVVRATTMGILSIMAGVFYRKSDKWQDLSLAMLILLIYNPFLIESVSVLLSFVATIGIISKLSKSVAISATLVIIPIIVIFFNRIYITSLVISMIIGTIIGVIVIGGLVFIVFYKVLEIIMFKKIFIQIITFLINCIIKLADIGSSLPLNQIYVTTPNIIIVILYYIIILTRIFYIFGL